MELETLLKMIGSPFIFSQTLVSHRAKARPAWAPSNRNAKRIVSDILSFDPISAYLELSHTMK